MGALKIILGIIGSLLAVGGVTWGSISLTKYVKELTTTVGQFVGSSLPIILGILLILTIGYIFYVLVVKNARNIKNVRNENAQKRQNKMYEKKLKYDTKNSYYTAKRTEENYKKYNKKK